QSRFHAPPATRLAFCAFPLQPAPPANQTHQHVQAPAWVRLLTQKTRAHSGLRVLPSSLLLSFGNSLQDPPKRNCAWPAPLPSQIGPRRAGAAKKQKRLTLPNVSRLFLKWLLLNLAHLPRVFKLEQSETYFNRYGRPHRLPVWSRSRLAAPSPHGLDCLLIQSQARALHHAHIRHTVVGLDNHFHDHDALIFRLPRLFRIGRVRLVVARRHSHAVHA